MKRVSFGDREGIDLEYTKATHRLSVGGWYDSFVGIESRTFTLAEWCRKLGIPPAHLREAAKELEVDG